MRILKGGAMVLLTAIFSQTVFAQETLTLSTDSIVVADSIAAPKKMNIVQKFLNYFKESDKPKPYKKFDFSVIGGPHYSSDTQLGLGIVAAGLYRKDLTDSITQPSNVSLFGDVSTVGFYLIGIRGNHIFPLDKYRINYNVYFYSFPRKFWGIGYKDGQHADDNTKFDQKYVHLDAEFMVRLADNLYVGPSAEFAWTSARKVSADQRYRWHGQSFTENNVALGLSMQYDTRDNLTETYTGTLVQLQQRFLPRFMGNDYAFSYTDLKICYFKPIWKGGILASMFHSKFNYGNVPWYMMATFGGTTMRGYYDGRFRDKNEMDLTVELRQHVWRRNGFVVWGGLGTVFGHFSGIHHDRLLPCGGIGYRWRFKQRTNVRLDFGVGRGETAFMFGVNEAF